MTDETHDFHSPDEYARFVNFVDEQIRQSDLSEIAQDANYGKGQIFGGRWFRNTRTKAIWRLVAPDFPFKGIWEEVERP